MGYRPRAKLCARLEKLNDTRRSQLVSTIRTRVRTYEASFESYKVVLVHTSTYSCTSDRTSSYKLVRALYKCACTSTSTSLYKLVQVSYKHSCAYKLVAWTVRRLYKLSLYKYKLACM